MREDWLNWRDRLVAKLDGVDPSGCTLREPLRKRAALVLIDDVASAIGSSSPEAAVYAERVRLRRSVAEASSVTGRVTGSREHVAAHDAIAMCSDELDEGYRPAMCHGGLYALPALLAEAEATGATLGEVLSALLVSYEVSTAFARGFKPPSPLRLHAHATLSPIGASAGISWMRLKSAQATLDIAYIAASMSLAGPFRGAITGQTVRNLWPAGGSTLGFLAVDGYESGIRCDADTAVAAFTEGFGTPVNSDELAANTGRWAIEDGYHKVYATCQYLHAAVEAAYEISVAHADRQIAEIASVQVETHPLARQLADRTPTTTLGGKFSLPHAVAAVLVQHGTDRSVFSDAALHLEGVHAVRDLIEIVPFEPLPTAPHDRPARVTVRFTDGSSATATSLSALGGPDRPVTDDQVMEKAAGAASVKAPGFEAAAHHIVSCSSGLTSPWREIRRQWA